jgi:hypothetical protein
MTKKFFSPAWLIAGILGVVACGPPKYVNYTSIQGDWSSSVPWAWNVMTDSDGARFASTTFLGPFEPEFYLGAPSLSVRWHAYNSSHKLRDGLVESYSSADDYIKQMLANVYGPDYELVSDKDIKQPQPVSEVLIGGRKAKHFVVLSSVAVPPSTKWGTSIDPESGRLVNVRRHAYTILPLDKGFYVIVYPATNEGYGLYVKQYNNLVNSFKPLKEGPSGPALAKK